MAAEAELRDRAIGFLQSIKAMLEDLPEVVDDWPTMLGWERASWSIEWDDAMSGQLVELDHTYRQGLLPEPCGEDYRRLLADLARAMPLIERLDLFRPPVPLTDTREVA